MLPDTSSRDVAGRKAAIWRRGLHQLWTELKGELWQRVSEEENSNSATVIHSLCYYSKVHLFCVS
jgi:hypothetical protein